MEKNRAGEAKDKISFKVGWMFGVFFKIAVYIGKKSKVNFIYEIQTSFG